MIVEWLGSMKDSGADMTLSDFLRETPFDELVEFDLFNNHNRNLYHVEGKYYVPVMESSYDSLYRFSPDNMIHPDDRDRQVAFMNPDDMLSRLEHAPVKGVLESEVRYKLVDGGWCWTAQVLVSGRENGLPEGIVQLYIYDIQRVKDRLTQRGPVHRTVTPDRVRLDELTGLPMDRDFFPMARDRRETLSGEWCIIAIEIEHFRLFVDWHGRRKADQLLTGVGGILDREAKDTQGLAGYHGMNEFWLMTPFDMPRINALYQELRDMVIDYSGSVGFLPIFGVCVMRGRGEEITDVFNHAAMTAEQVKGDLHNRIRVYNAAAYNRTVEEYRMLADFQRSLEAREVFFCLQPQCRVSNGAVVGAESLARWRRADGRMVPPGVFVPLLEKYGMVTNLDKYIWEEVCKWLARWTGAGHKAVPVSVNLSQIDILTIDVPACFGALLKKYDLPPSLIKVEITESAYVSDTAIVRETARRLREMGLLVLMDDFGSGYSSLNMLRSLNVDIIKLDAQFLRIQDQEERKGISILESIINMTRNMHLPIIVEGVETQEQINFLSDLGCRYMQGYYFHRPMPVREFEEMIRDERNIDLNGFEFKGNVQMHPREFLDENVFSDSMLNNILGPVAIYRLKDGVVDIDRYNQQFYQMVGIPIHQLEERSRDMMKYLYEEDVQCFLRMMADAEKDHLNGAKGVVRVYRPNHTLRWIAVQLYYLSEDSAGKHFYGACHDETELQYINTEIPGGYFRCTMDDKLEFQYMSPNFLDMVGFTEAEIRERFDNSIVPMIYPDDLHMLRERLPDIQSGRFSASQPYRIRCKGGVGYIYVVAQTILCDLSGGLSLMTITTDVTDMMKLRNQMRLLSRYLSDSIVFLHKQSDGRWRHYVAVNGLEGRLGLDQEALENVMNSYEFYSWVDPDSRPAFEAQTLGALAEGSSFELDCDLRMPGREPIRLQMKMDHVSDARAKVEYICLMRAI